MGWLWVASPDRFGQSLATALGTGGPGLEGVVSLRRALTIPATAAAVIAAVAAGASAGLASGGNGAVTIAGSRPAAAAGPAVGSVPAASRIDFSVQLGLRDAAGAAALAKAASTPGTRAYGHYLTPAQWEARFSPTRGQVSEVVAFLRGSGFTVGRVSADRMAVDASGTAAQVERAFGTSLSYRRVDGQKVRVNDRAVSV